MKPFTSEFPPDPLWPKDMVKLRRLLSNHTQWGWKVLEVREVKKKGPLGAPLFRAVLLSPLGVPRAFKFHLYLSGVLSDDHEVPLSPEEQLAYLGKEPIMNPWRKMSRTRSNPKVAGVELYDPKMEQLRAQRQAVYESQILKALGKKGPFRDPRTGLRADIVLLMSEIGSAVSQFMFAMGTSIQQRDKRLKEGSQTPTSKAAMESMRRYADPDHLIRNRQDYEETLGLARASGFYRVTQEYAAWTPTGYAYFIWPLAPGVLLPQFSLSLEKAREKAAVLNATADPRRTGVWWKPPTKRYTMDDLCYWIPGPAAFGVQAPEQKTRRKAG